MQHLFADESLGHGAGIAIAWPWVVKDETLMNRVTRVSTDSAVANEQPWVCLSYIVKSCN